MSTPPSNYWNDRARRFAGQGAGLGAVCSYGMPGYYNAAIDLEQRLALRPWIDDVEPGTSVLDVGCGVGRWSRRLGRRQALVTGIDISSRMVDEARRRTARDGLSRQCRFLEADVSDPRLLDELFDQILVVTVLQHITDPERLHDAVRNLASLTVPGGRLVLLEAAPQALVVKHDHEIFVARTENEYRQLFESSGLRVEAVTGVDPAPLRFAALARYRHLHSVPANVLLAAATLVSAPQVLAFGREWVSRSWHKVFVLRRETR